MPPKRRGRGRPKKENTSNDIDNDSDVVLNSRKENTMDFDSDSDENMNIEIKTPEKSDADYEDFDDENEYNFKRHKTTKGSRGRRGRPSKKEHELSDKIAKKKKKNISEDAEGSEANELTKYKPGKFPRNGSAELSKTAYDKDIPLDEESELWRDRNNNPWDIPDFPAQLFDTIEKYIWKRGGKDNLQFFKDFIRWPSRKFYPDYYHKIPTEDCASLKDIQKRSYMINTDEDEESSVEPGHLYTPDKYNYEQMILDVDSIFKNCDLYNESDTVIVRAAYQLVNFIKMDILKLKNEYRNFELNDYIKKSIETKIIKNLEKVTESSMFETLEDNFKSFVKPSRELDTSLKLIEPFLDLVAEKHFPDYYQLIYRPISFGMIKANLKAGFYKTVYDFYLDVELLFFNCKTYNPSESLLHLDATHLLSYLRIIFEQLILELEEYSKENPLVLYKPNEEKYLEYKNKLLKQKGDNENRDDHINSRISDFGELDNGLKQQQEQIPVSALTSQEVSLLQNGGEINKYETYPGNIKFELPVKYLQSNAENNFHVSIYDKNEDLLSSLVNSKSDNSNVIETSFSNLKLTFFQDYRFNDKNMTNINLNDFENIYSTSSKISEVLQKDNNKFELFQFNFKNSNPSKTYSYSLKNPLSGYKNLYTHVELQLIDLGIDYSEGETEPPYTYKCQVYFNNSIGGAPVVVSPKPKNIGNTEKTISPMICLYNIKLSERRSFVSIVVTREKKGVIDLKETINLWFNV